MIITILGFCIGIKGLSFFLPAPLLIKTKPAVLTAATSYLSIIFVCLFLMLFILELYSFSASGISDNTFKGPLFFKNLKYSVFSLLIGLTGGGLYLLYGNWTYTSILKDLILTIEKPYDHFKLFYLYLFLAVFLWMLISAIIKKSIKIKFKSESNFTAHIIGGILMGAGVVLIPGGNDILILNSLPGLSFHAFPAFCSILVGIVTIFSTKKFFS